MVGRLIVDEENARAVFEEKPPEDSLVFGLPTPVGEGGPKLADHDERQHHGLGLLQDGDRPGDTLTEIDVPIRFERNPAAE